MKRTRDVRDQLEGILERIGIELISSSNNVDAIKKAITSGFFLNFARLQHNGGYRTTKHPEIVYIHPSSGLATVRVAPRWILYSELVLTRKEYMRQVTEIKKDWLVEIAPHYYEWNDFKDDNKTRKTNADEAEIFSTSYKMERNIGFGINSKPYDSCRKNSELLLICSSKCTCEQKSNPLY
ncbi:hypothetical protein ACFE04_010073 [Oxalis oulophora]